MTEPTLAERLHDAVPPLPAGDPTVPWGRSRRTVRRRRIAAAAGMAVVVLVAGLVVLRPSDDTRRLDTVGQPVRSPWNGGHWVDVGEGPGGDIAVHRVVAVGDDLIVFGSTSPPDERSYRPTAGAIYDVIRGTWSTIADAPQLHITDAVWTGTEVLVWGLQHDPVGNPPGVHGQVISARTTRSAGALYDPAHRTWRPIPANPDLAYGGGQWDGREWFVFGTTPTDGGIVTAFDPRTGTWRSPPAPPVALDLVKHPSGAWSDGDGLVILLVQPGHVLVHDGRSDGWRSTPQAAPEGSYAETGWTGKSLVQLTHPFDATGRRRPIYQRLDPATGVWSPMRPPPTSATLHSSSPYLMDHRAVFTQDQTRMSTDPPLRDDERSLYGYDDRTDSWATLLPAGESHHILSWSETDLWDIQADGTLSRFVVG